MVETDRSLVDILILLMAAVAIVATFRQLKISPVLGFLVAGAAIGPHGFGIISNVEEKSYIAEFGVVFLLFVIGLELSFKKLGEMRAYILGLGGLQFVITTIIGGLLMRQIVDSWQVAVLLGGALALSSTAIVLQLLDERGQRMTQTGRVAFSVLLLQDLAVIPLLILLKIIAQGQDPENLTSEIVDTFLRALGAIMTLMVVGRYLLKPVFSMIASTRSSDLFVATTLLIALGASYATDKAGLSLALGAFIAGLLVAETEFKKQVEADVMPFKGLLLGLFFMTVGMSFDTEQLIHEWTTVLFYATLLVVGKAMIIVGLARFLKLSWESALRVGLLLGQGSEFAFVLLKMAMEEDLVNKSLGQVLLLSVTVSMAITPLVYAASNDVFKRVFRKNKKYSNVSQTEDLNNHVIICGFGWVGENLAKFLSVDKVNFVALDQSPGRVRKGRDMGFPVYYGDGSRADMLKSLKADKAKAIVITVHDTKVVTRIIQAAHNLFPDVPIIARSKHLDNVEAMKGEGAAVVVPEAFESSIQIGRATMALLGAAPEELTRVTRIFRDKLYEEFDMLKSE